jgi:GntR family transcriptional regulator / MocR family aminotransferase
LLVSLDPGAKEPMFRQLFDSIRAAIVDGRLTPGLRLPSTRVLAADLHLSRNTVVAAFDHLRAEGYIESYVGRGTSVVMTLPQPRNTLPRRTVRPRPPVHGESARPSARSTQLARAVVSRSLLSDPSAPFRLGVPALDQFPLRAWQRQIRSCARALSPRQLNYADAFGLAPLRRAIAEYLSASRGLSCEPAQVLVLAGAQEALALSAQVALDVGDGACVEDPGYPGAAAALLGAGARIVAIPVDDEGIDVRRVSGHVPAARLAYVTPSHQFPLGVTMSLVRRRELLEWARRAASWIVEDDHGSEHRYAERPLPALYGLDEAERVVYCGTFSRVLFPALRLGYAVVPPGLVDAFTAARRAANIHSAAFEQATLARFIAEGHFERHLRRMRVLYRERRDALVDALRAELGDAVVVQGAEAGMQLVVWLPSGTDASDVQRRAAARGLDVIPVSAFAIDRVVRPGLVLGYAHMHSTDIRTSCRDFAGVLLDSLRHA